jgi:heavy metal sensor kinase
VIRRISIRTRLTLLGAAVAVVIVAASMTTVFLIEQAYTHDRLVSRASQAAGDLARAETSDSHHGADETDGDSGSNGPKLLSAYLGSRETLPTLLLTTDPGGHPEMNSARAAKLAGYLQMRPGSHRTVEVDGQPYVLAAAARPKGQIALAAVPSSDAEAEIGRLLRAMLLVGLAALIPTMVVAWLAAGRALAPLSRIAGRAASITAGDMSERVGPIGTHDEVAKLATSIDAMLDRLERAFSAQTRLMHDASHELRTPLTIARGNLEVALLQHQDAPDELRSAIELAISEIDRMSRLVDGMLRLARSEGGRSSRALVGIEQLAADSLERSRPLAERDWRLDVAGAGDAQVLGDRDALEQVLLNLLANAVRHTDTGQLIAVHADRENGEVVVTIEDGGEGISPQALPTIFDRFARADAARNRDSGGAGLGLAICREIVEAHGGRIGAESVAGHGARFVLHLPLAR